MSSFFRAHRILAIIVLIVAGAWVVTGEFAAVGSEEPGEAHAATPEQAAPEQAAAVSATPVLRTVAAMTPVFADHAREIRISGATEADKKAVLAARSDGIVAKLSVTNGQEIKADTVVLTLEGPEISATVETARASLAEAAQQLEVGETLFARGSLPDLELTSRRAAKAAAEAQLSQAEAAVDRLMLRAPFSGTVDSVDVEHGEWVQTGAPIATLLSLDPIVVKAEISERDVGYVAVGAKAIVRLVSGGEMEGTIRHVANQASEQTRTFVVEVALPNPDHRIAAGVTAEVRLYADPQPAVTVPRSVITLSEDGVIGLRVVGDDNKARFVPVDLIDDTNGGMVITGVPADVRIITAGQDLVRDGEEVIVSETPAAEAKP